MGNAASTNAARPAGLGLDSFTSELGNDVLYEKSLGSSRFLKTIRARHQDGRIVVKVFIKPDLALSLKSQFKRINDESDALQECHNVLGYKRWVETDRAGYLIRQWLANNLYDRISTRPFLSVVEKKWIAFQLLTGLRDAVAKGVSHGDIKSENIVLTTWNWAYICDFSSFKPTYLPEDDPADFSYFFDTSGRRACYIAPERFYPQDSDIAKKKANLALGKRDGRVSEAMDVFSLGCVIAELFLDGSPPFNLSQLLNYRTGEYSPSQFLGKIEDESVRGLVESMVQLNPNNRLSCEDYLQLWRGKAFPQPFYTFLHPFLLNLQDVASIAIPAPRPTPAPGAGTPNGMRTPVGPAGAANAPALAVETAQPLKSNADDIIEKLWHDFDYASGYFSVRNDEDAALASSSSNALFPLQLHIPGYTRPLPSRPGRVSPRDDDLAIILLPLLSSNIRNCQNPRSVSRTLDLMLALSRMLSDETVLDRMLPYVVAMLQHDHPATRSQALLAVTQLLLLVHMITPSNASVFTEYIIPNVRYLASDAEESVRCTLARCIPSLATAGRRFLEMTQTLKANGSFKYASANVDEAHESSYDYNLGELQNQIQEMVTLILVDNSTAVKRSLLEQIAALASFFGREKTNDVLLSHMLTYLNETDWQLRESFFEAVIGLAPEVGPLSVEEYLLPLMLQASADAEDFVAARVINSIADIVAMKTLSKPKIWETVTAVIGLVCHPDPWIRQASARLIATAAGVLPLTDAWCILYPALRKLLRCDIKAIDELTILAHVESPVQRIVYDAAVAWAGRAQRSSFWRVGPASQEGAGTPTKRRAGVQPSQYRSDDDDAQLEKLRQLGMRPDDEIKLAAMRERILKAALSRPRQASLNGLSDPADLFGPSAVGLQDLGVSLQNILIKMPPNDDGPRGPMSKLHSTEAWPRKFSGVDGPQSPTSIDLTRSQRGDSPAVEDLRRRLMNRTASFASSVNPSSPPPGDRPVPGDLYALAPARLSQVSLNSSDNADAEGLAATVRPKGPAQDAKSVKRGAQQGLGVGKVAPAIAEDTTNVLGTMDTESRATGPEEGAASQTPDLQSAFSGPRASPSPFVPHRFASTYEGKDPNIRYLVERTYQESYREPLPEFGPPVPRGIPRKRALRSSFPPRERKSRSPHGTLVGHLIEHKGAISGIAVSPDFVFFATGSEDGTVKVWDSIRIEKNTTSRSRHTWDQGGKITSVCSLEGSRCVASASDNGTVWIHRIDVSLSASLPKYGKPQLIRQYRAEPEGAFVTAMTHYNAATSSTLVYATNASAIVLLDVRTMRQVQQLDLARHLGPPTSLCLDKDRIWLVCGTLSGYLTLWDLRFGLLLKTWRAFRGPVRQVDVHPTKGKGRWIAVAGQHAVGDSDTTHQVVQVWDLESGRVKEAFAVSSRSPAKPIDFANAGAAGDGPESASRAIERLLSEQVAAPTATRPSSSASAVEAPCAVQAFVIGGQFAPDNLVSSGELVAVPEEGGSGSRSVTQKTTGYLLTGGLDRKIRFWDMAEIERSTLVSGLELDDVKPVYRSEARTDDVAVFVEEPPRDGHAAPGKRAATSSRLHRSIVIANQQHSMQRNHSDAVTALAVVDLPFRCIVSGDRAGTIHVYE